MDQIVAKIIFIASAYVTVCIIFLFTARKDFWLLRIDNKSVYISVFAYVSLLVIERLVFTTFDRQQLAGLDNSGQYLLFRPGSDITAAVFLFLIGFCLWMLRMLGAGDAKLLFPIGLFTGWDYMLPFAMGLIALGTIALAVLKLPLPAGREQSKIRARVREIRETGRIPYGVIMTGALLAALAAKYLSALG